MAGDLRTLIGQFKRMFRDQASLGDMTLSQVSVLGRLHRDGPATVTNLAGAAAHDADDRIIYDQTNGNLYYDADGNGAGAAILFANLSGHPAIVAADFQVI